ncbi:hypothetical protein [Bosea caraganae]|uniref:hypothetical protein n=1 Tax=Bosea caraganae TaxID=2763117 RepID=UPI0011C04929|nr:hypothetical protein [Bosea caraganae]
MTLGNMRENGTRWIALYCPLPCSHHTDILVDELADEVEVPSIGRRYRCTKCGRKGPESRPAGHLSERPGKDLQAAIGGSASAGSLAPSSLTVEAGEVALLNVPDAGRELPEN